MPKGMMVPLKDAPVKLEFYATPDKFAKQLLRCLPIAALNTTATVDLCCGTGALGKALADLTVTKHLTGVDIREDLLEATGLDDYDHLVVSDATAWVREVTSDNGGFATLVLCNPPFSLFTEMAKASIDLLTEDGVAVLIGIAGMLESKKRGPFWRSYGRFLRSLIFPINRVPFIDRKKGLMFTGYVFARQSIDIPPFQWVEGGE